jgi:hypothetical protein
MTGDRRPAVMSTPRRAIPVHGGECVVDCAAAALRLNQSRFRHMHALGFVFSALSVGTALVALATDWQYVAEGQVVEWWLIGGIGLWLPAATYGRVAWRRLRGYTGTRRIPLRSIEDARLTTESVRWYWKQRRTVPLLIVTYRADRRHCKRRVLLEPRFDDDDVTDLVAALRNAGIRVAIDDSVEDALDAGTPGGAPRGDVRNEGDRAR